MSDLTHLDPHGNARMVDVGDKPVNPRVAVAEGYIQIGAEAMAMVQSRTAKKGDVLGIAQLAGIQAAKRASDLIPLCHPLPLSSVEVHLSADETTHRIRVEATVRATWRTGVEMEALTAATAALLTVYDMLKAVDKGMVLETVQLLEKRGGRSGAWSRDAGTR